MPLSDPVLTGPGAGRTVTTMHGSSTELKLAGEQTDGDWSAVEWHLRGGDEMDADRGQAEQGRR